MSRREWDRAIFKPVVSGGARDTYLVGAGESGAHEEEFARLLTGRDMMVQPFMERIVSDGEVSLTFVSGSYSHAVVKHPGAGDYRVQEDLGGSLKRCSVDQGTVELAQTIIDASATDLLYARVDLVPDTGGQLRLMELELIEPELFLRFEPASVTTLAAAIGALVEG